MKEIKIHDVMHDPVKFHSGDIEEKLIKFIQDDRVENIRIATGHRNSPIFITFDDSDISVHSSKVIARKILQEFSYYVSGVDIDKCLRDKNIKIQ